MKHPHMRIAKLTSVQHVRAVLTTDGAFLNAFYKQRSGLGEADHQAEL